MAEVGIALVVVGSGEVSQQEVNDLLDDSYGEVDELGLVVPVDKDLFTDAVKDAVDWYNNDKDVYPVRTEGSSMSRGSSKLGPKDPEDHPQPVEKFVDFLTAEEFADWDEVHVLIAMPKEDDEDAYEFYADIADAASEAGFKVMDLTAGLDDIVVTDAEVAEEPEPEPEPEPVKEKPAPRQRKSRAKKAEPEPEPVVEEEPEERADTVEKIIKELAGNAPIPQHVLDRDATHKALLRVAGAVMDLAALYAPSEAPEPLTEAEAVNEAAKEGVESKASSRGRGRPRTNFEVKQVWDEDDEKWVPRPAGRMRKGTKWRTVHVDTDDVLDEGTA